MKFAPSHANCSWKNAIKNQQCILDIWTIYGFCGITVKLSSTPPLHDILNTHSPAIRLSTRIEKNSIDFLDVTVFKGPKTNETGILDTKVFFKPTDTHQLLNKSSFHPKHTFVGIIKSQITRFYRICSQITDFETSCAVSFKALRKRGYSKRFL